MSVAATMKPKVGGLGGGWLSMAPQIDEEPAPSTSALLGPSVPATLYQAPPASSSSPSRASFSSYQSRPHNSTTVAPRRVLPRTNARFKLGDSSVATPSSPAPDSPYSRGSAYDSPPPFDVRASFAPMPKWGSVGAGILEGGDATSDRQDRSHPVDAFDLEQRLGNRKEDVESDDDEDESVGIRYAGRQWKGKTAHAVEQEMEALGDRTVMSYAPDAVYLASRLEGLRRNLEVGGERFKRRAWEDYEDDEEQPTADEADATGKEDKVQSVTTDAKSEVEEDVPMPGLEERSIDSAVSSLATSEGITPYDEVLQDPMQHVTIGEGTLDQAKQDDEVLQQSTRTAEANAKAAALDARVEIRTLRRPDLEQVRELHCYQGDNDKVETESYTTSAGFLLRLLVDEHHVCLVAVAKPLPEPPTLPSRFSPGAPPPSLDMPPSRSPFLVANEHRNTGSFSPFRQYAPHTQSKLVPLSHLGKGVPEATAPRSFGVGADSSSSIEEEENEDAEEEDREMPDSLFGNGAKKSTLLTGVTSPFAIAEKDEDATEVDEMDLEAKDSTDESAELASPSPEPGIVLAGPTHDVAPPRAIRVMGAPPLNGLPSDGETILGVASARIKVVQRSEGEDIFGSSGALDSSWPGLDPKGEKSIVTREAHIISLSVLPGERGQGLGARLLDHLLDECKRRTAGPRIHLAAGSNTSTEEAAMAPRVHENAPMRTFLEVHPSNHAAIELYKSRRFQQVKGSKGVIKHYFRGDNRIPNAIRVQVGGSDGIRMERFDFS